MTEIAFDDLDGLRTTITEEWSDWGPEYEMTQEKVNQFAELTGDHQWIHVDVERATAGPFGGPIAHGFFTLSLLPILNRTGSVRITGQTNVVNYGADGLRLLAPVPVGSPLHASYLQSTMPSPSRSTASTHSARHTGSPRQSGSSQSVAPSPSLSRLSPQASATPVQVTSSEKLPLAPS